MPQRKVFINKTWILQRTNAKTNIFINKIRMLQRTILQRTNATPNSFINKIRILQRTMLQRKNGTSNSFINKIRMLQRTRRNTIGRRSTRVLMTCRAYPVWLERQSSCLLWFVRFSYQFGSVICLFAPLSIKIFF